MKIVASCRCESRQSAILPETTAYDGRRWVQQSAFKAVRISRSLWNSEKNRSCIHEKKTDRWNFWLGIAECARVIITNVGLTMDGNRTADGIFYAFFASVSSETSCIIFAPLAFSATAIDQCPSVGEKSVISSRPRHWILVKTWPQASWCLTNIFHKIYAPGQMRSKGPETSS